MNPALRVLSFWLVMIVLAVLFWKFTATRGPESQALQLAYTDFLTQADRGNVRDVTLYLSKDTADVRGSLRDSGKSFQVTIPKDSVSDITAKLHATGVALNVKQLSRGDWVNIFFDLLPILFIVGLWILLMRQMQVGRYAAVPSGKFSFLWTPWRYRYVAGLGEKKDNRCIFCDALALRDDARALIVFRGEKNFVILNQYPYTTGHSMVVPYAHESEFGAVDAYTLTEMMQLAQRLERAFAELYSPQGYNLGMNLGRSAGAGVTGHLHLHVLPRWSGDASFMTTVGETRVHPEELPTTYEKLRKALAA